MSNLVTMICIKRSPFDEMMTHEAEGTGEGMAGPVSDNVVIGCSPAMDPPPLQTRSFYTSWRRAPKSP